LAPGAQDWSFFSLSILLENLQRIMSELAELFMAYASRKILGL
jgi:hypothetical protein